MAQKPFDRPINASFEEWVEKMSRSHPLERRHCRYGSLDRHLVVDNYATHKHPKVKAWLKRHPRFQLHFTPTSASWINLVERFFGLITSDAIRRGVFRSVAELKTAIEAYLKQHNIEPKPFVWTASAADILEKVARGRRVLESLH